MGAGQVAGAPRAVPGDGGVRPFWPQAGDEERLQVLRVGERAGLEQVQGHVAGGGVCGALEEQLLDQVGRLNCSSCDDLNRSERTRRLLAARWRQTGYRI